MTFCYTYYHSDRHYLRSPVGCLKCLNIIFGAISLGLLSSAYAPLFEDQFCLGIILLSLAGSTTYFVVYTLYPELRYLRWNRRFDNAFHLLVGFFLILAGIDLGQLLNSVSGKFIENVVIVSEEDEPYFEPGYVKGAAKIFMFINGVLYEIIGFVRVKGDGDMSSDDIDDGSLDDIEARRSRNRNVERQREREPLLYHGQTE